MLTKCNKNCIETIDTACGISQEIPCYDSIRSNCVILGEDLNLCSIDVKSTDSLKKIITAFDKVICGLKNSTIDIFFDDLVVDNCITKELVTDINNHKTIKLSIDENCLCNTIQDCTVPVTNPFIITSNKYNICGNQIATLTSIYSDTVWYNQSGVQIGTGAAKTVNSGGSYYAIHQGKVSNVITVVYNPVCQVYSYTRIKNFYKNCPAGTNSNEYTYSKVYTSEISYQDAVNKADLDNNIFNTEGQAIAESTGFCIGNTPISPVPSGCFNVFLSNVNCNLTPTSCNFDFTINNINCN